MQSELDLLEEEATLTELKAKNAELMAEKAKLETKNAEYIKLKDETAKLKTENTKLLKQIIEKYAKNKADIVKLKTGLQYPILFERIKVTILELEERNAILRPIIEEFAKKSEYNYLVTAFDKKNRKFQAKCIKIAEEILDEEPIIDWYKDVKKLEDIVNRDRLKRCLCQDNGIFLLEVWYDENPEIVIPQRIQKINNRTSLNKALTRKNDYWLTNLPNRKLKCLQHQTSNLSQDTRTGSSFPSVEEIKEWAPAQIVSFLESRNLYLTNSDIEMIKKNSIAGEDFLLLKENDLYRIGLPIGPARRIIQLIKKISRTPLMDRLPTNLVHVFIDNSNIWIEGKYTVGNLERLGTFDFDRNSYYFKQLQIDHGRLLTTVQCERKLGGAPFLVGSRPPPNDSLWARIRDQGFEVNIFDRDVRSHREKEVDTELVISATETITSNDPGVLVLIADDRDYRPLVKRALKHNWTVETWFWNSGVSSFLKSDTNFRSLDNCYRSFSYGLGPDLTEKNKVLEVTDGNVIQSLKNEDVLEWFNTLNLFGWWDWESYRAMRFYFNNSNHLETKATNKVGRKKVGEILPIAMLNFYKKKSK
ncbi:779_t:CDS:2, partial [Dentiscutata erythropus]